MNGTNGSHGEHDPFVSFLMPVRNGADFLEDALRSALDQTWQDLEVVVVDDGSTDATDQILSQLSKTDNRLRALRLAHPTGIVGALNHGLEATRGEYIARLDADDLASPDRISLQVELLEHRPDIVATGGRVLFVDRDGEPLGCPEVLLNHEEIDAYHMTGRGGGICHGAALLRRAVLLEMGGYRPEFSAAEDLDLFLRLAETGRLANIPKTVQKVRLHPTSHSLRNREAQRQQCFEALQQACQRRGVDPGAARFDFPRPKEDTFGSHEFYARFAIAHGFSRTALKHALRQVRGNPWATRAWRTLISTFLSAAGVRRGSHRATRR